MKTMETPASTEKLEGEEATYASSTTEQIALSQMRGWSYFKHYFTSREGWLGDYVSESRNNFRQ